MSPDIKTEQPIILIIDDDPTNLRLAIDYLEAQGFVVAVARDGETGLERARFAQPDLILLDVLMPGLDGFETCRRIKADPDMAAIPVIFTTVRAATLDKVEGFAAGGVDYLTKPFELEEFLARVTTHLTIRDLQRQLEQHNERLEQRVQERTAELAAANHSLQAEITRRKRHQQEKDKLLDIVRQQSEQLRALTNWLLESQHSKQQALAQTLQEPVGQKLELLEFNLNLLDQHLAAEVLLPSFIQEMSSRLANAAQILAQLKADLSTVEAGLSQPIPEAQNPLLRLSQREREIVQLIAESKSPAEIANLLYISTSTVYTHRRHIIEKLGLADVFDLVQFARQYPLKS